MQNKKPLLQRLLVIYITFFIVILVSIAHSFLPNFSKGYSEGSEMGKDIVQNWMSGKPRMIYLLDGISVQGQTPLPIEGLSTEDGREIEVYVGNIGVKVAEPAPNASMLQLGFRSIGGSAWLYALVVISSLTYAAIIVLMFIIIHSLRRSIREERMLDKRNVWLLRTIGLLTIFSALCRNVADWSMSCKAAELLANANLGIDTTFQISYETVIMGILILFAAEVFAIGQNLSEEQKLTI